VAASSSSATGRPSPTSTISSTPATRCAADGGRGPSKRPHWSDRLASDPSSRVQLRPHACAPDCRSLAASKGLTVTEHPGLERSSPGSTTMSEDWVPYVSVLTLHTPRTNKLPTRELARVPEASRPPSTNRGHGVKVGRAREPRRCPPVWDPVRVQNTTAANARHWRLDKPTTWSSKAIARAGTSSRGRTRTSPPSTPHRVA